MLAIDTTRSILRLTNNVMSLCSRGRAEFRCRRRRKSLPPPPAEFWSARRCASRIWFAPAGKVAAARLRGLDPHSRNKGGLLLREGEGREGGREGRKRGGGGEGGGETKSCSKVLGDRRPCTQIARPVWFHCMTLRFAIHSYCLVRKVKQDTD